MLNQIYNKHQEESENAIKLVGFHLKIKSVPHYLVDVFELVFLNLPVNPVTLYADDAVIIYMNLEQKLLYRFEKVANELNMVISVYQTKSLLNANKPRNTLKVSHHQLQTQLR